MTDFCAGIVTYQPDTKRLDENLSSVYKQVERVYIIDNHSANVSEIQTVARNYKNVVYIGNNQNNGIARALNQMCDIAYSQGYKWILTLDQDTVIPEGMIDGFSKYVGQSEIGIICPGVIYEGWNCEKKIISETEYVYACMTSAAFTRLEAWKKVGGFREDYFIDFVDNEFCMRLSLNQYKVIRINGYQIKHRLGDARTKKFFGVTFRLSKHSPIRLYYMARNNYTFICEYRNNLNVLKERMKMIYVLIQGVISSDEKKKSVRYIVDGIKDAKNGILGDYRYRKQGARK